MTDPLGTAIMAVEGLLVRELDERQRADLGDILGNSNAVYLRGWYRALAGVATLSPELEERLDEIHAGYTAAVASKRLDEATNEATGRLAAGLNVPRRLIDGYETVDHPSHYGGDTVYEAIKVIEAWGLGFCLGNTVKYIARAGHKPTSAEIEDLEKAAWYLQREIDRLKQ